MFFTVTYHLSTSITSDYITNNNYLSSVLSKTCVEVDIFFSSYIIFSMDQPSFILC